LGGVVCVAGGYEIFLVGTAREVDPVKVCGQLNAYVLPHYGAHAALCLLLLLVGEWWALIFQLPLLGYRVYAYATGKHRYLSTSVQTGHTPRLYATVVLYGLLELYYLACFAR